MAGRPLIVIGWDGVDAETVHDLLDAGRLPALASIATTGHKRTFAGLSGLGDDSHWTSFSTGVGPGDHGRFHFVQRVPGSYRLQTTPHLLEPFWAELADRGMSVSVLDVPKAPQARRPSTRELSDWMPHGPSGPEPIAWPDSLRPAGGWHRPHGRFAECDEKPVDLAARRAHIVALDERRDARTSLLLEWLTRDRSDLTIAVYAAAHCAGHHYWNLHEPRSDDDHDLADQLGDPLVGQLEAMDADLARLIDAVGPDADFAVFSLTGMRSSVQAHDITAAAIAELTRVWLRRHPRNRAETTALGLVHRLKHGPTSTHFAAKPFSVIDLRFSGATGVRLALAGRDHRGSVRASQRRPLLDWLGGELRQMTDENGARILADVFTTEDRYPGPHHDVHADLIAVWGVDQPRMARTPSVTVDGFDRTPKRPGDHRNGGWLIASGELDAPDADVGLTGLGRWISTCTIRSNDSGRAPSRA